MNSKTDIKKILHSHALWLSDPKTGQQASFADMDLTGADFEECDLAQADFQDANLKGANFQDADLRHANFEGANLERSTFENADLRHAFLQRANLLEASFKNACLSKADLTDADLEDANLNGADLRHVKFESARLEGANFENAKLPAFQIVPVKGDFIAYSKTENGVVEVLVPADAQRSSNLVNRISHTTHVKVLSGDEGACPIYKKPIFKIGKIARTDGFDNHPFNCHPSGSYANGVMIFITPQEAEDFGR